MNRSTGLWLLALGVLAAGLMVWQLPALMRKIPARYVARLPEPVQQLGRRDVVPILPTAAVVAANSDLLLAPPTFSALPPATPTSPPAAPIVETDVPPTPTPIPTETPIPLPTATPLPATARLDGIFHQTQYWNNCGPATLAMSLSYFDLWVTQSATAAYLKPDPEDRNVSPDEMAAYVNEQTELAAISRANGDLSLLRTLLANGIPVIVEIGIDPPGEYAWLEWYGHYLLVVAYDDARQEFFVYDSWLGTGDVPEDTSSTRGRRWRYDELDRYWQHFNRNYLVLHQPDDEDRVAQIIGPAMDDTTMWQHALAVAQREVADNRENPFAWFNLGTNYAALGNHEAAATAFDQARAIGLPRRMLWYQFGPFEAYYQVGRYEDLITLANVALDRPYIEEVLYYRGLAQLALGERSKARQDFAAAAAFNPRFSPAAEALQALDGG